MACGPPMAPTTSGKVMNGPTPIMSIMFSTVASFTVSSRASCGGPDCGSVRFMSGAHQVHEEADSTGNSGGELAKKRVSGVDVQTFAVAGGEKAAAERLLAGIVAAQQRLKFFTPGGHEVHAALLHPPVEIFFGDLVRKVEDGTVRVFDLDGSGLVTHALAAELRVVGSEVSGIEIVGAEIILHEHGAAVLDEIEEQLVTVFECGL